MPISPPFQPRGIPCSANHFTAAYFHWQGIAGVLLLIWAQHKDGRLVPRGRDALLFISCGAFIFLNQACFIVGDKLAGAIIGSAWQPTQPVFTLLISLFLGWEKLTVGKTAGIGLSFAGAAFMVTYGEDFGAEGAGSLIAGNVLFFFNCLGTSLYVICAKIALGRGYPPSTVTAWSYLAGASMLFPVAAGLSSSCSVVAFICPYDTEIGSGEPPHSCGDLPTSCDPFAVPSSAVLPLAYWILFNSCAAYWLMTWANRHAKASFVLAYCALQPLTSVVLSVIIISTVGHIADLKMPGLNALGAIAILAGLALIVRDGQKQHQADESAGNHESRTNNPRAFAKLDDPDREQGRDDAGRTNGRARVGNECPAEPAESYRER